LPPQSRAKDAVDAAGGTTEEAELNAINLSLRIFDEDHIIIPKIGVEIAETIISNTRPSNTGASTDSSAGSSNAGSSNTGISNSGTSGTSDSKTADSGASRLVNINTATSNELQTLRGVGPVMAGRIIEYREKNGPFKNKSDIKKISGIGEKTYESLANHITVD